MPQVTVEEPKTVVDEVQKYKCAQCKGVVDEDDINVQAVLDDTEPSAASLKRAEWTHLCDECVENERYQTLVDIHKLKDKGGEYISIGVQIGTIIGFFCLGAAMFLPHSIAWTYIGGPWRAFAGGFFIWIVYLFFVSILLPEDV